MAGSGEAQTVQQVVRGTAKVGRNDPCPCGSGKKYKKCCGAVSHPERSELLRERRRTRCAVEGILPS